MEQRRWQQRLSGLVGLVVAWQLMVLSPPPVQAQLREIPRITEAVYTAMPSLPRLDQFQTAAGESLDTSFVRRVLLYHMRSEGRALNSRLDWKLTFADYLGINLTMFAQQYPGADQFSENPYTADLEAFRALTRADREQLLAALLDAVEFDGIVNSLDVATLDPDLPSPFAVLEPAAPVVTPPPVIDLPSGGSSADLLQGP